jgi:hypothetical protein
MLRRFDVALYADCSAWWCLLKFGMLNQSSVSSSARPPDLDLDELSVMSSFPNVRCLARPEGQVDTIDVANDSPSGKRPADGAVTVSIWQPTSILKYTEAVSPVGFQGCICASGYAGVVEPGRSNCDGVVVWRWNYSCMACANAQRNFSQFKSWTPNNSTEYQ